MDYVSGLNLSKSGCRYVLSVVDGFSNFSFLYPTKDMTSETTARCLLDVVSYTGIFSQLFSDNQSSYISAVMNEFWNLLNIKSVQVAVYSPKNNRAEKTNALLGTGLRTMLAGGDLTRWDEAIPIINLYIRGAQSVSRPFSPFQLLYGFNPRLQPLIETNQVGGGESANKSEYVENLRQRIKLFQTVHIQNVAETMVKRVEDFNKKVARPYNFSEGENVGVRVHTKGGSEEIGKKFLNKIKGPFVLSRFCADHKTVWLRNPETRRLLKFRHHVDNLVPFVRSKTRQEKIREIESNLSVEKEIERETQKNKGVKPEENLNSSKRKVEAQTATEDGGLKAVRITEQRGEGQNREFFVSWAPKNGIYVRPSCVREREIEREVVQEWKQKYKENQENEPRYSRTGRMFKRRVRMDL